MQIGNETYKVWADGLWSNFIYDKANKGDMVSYTFYSGIKIDGTSDAMLFANFNKKQGQMVTEQDITGAFIEAISRKIYSNILYNENESFVDALKTLPKKFFTQENCDLVLDSVLSKTSMLNKSKKLPKESINKIDNACCKFMETASEINSTVKVGSGRDYIGK